MPIKHRQARQIRARGTSADVQTGLIIWHCWTEGHLRFGLRDMRLKCLSLYAAGGACFSYFDIGISSSYGNCTGVRAGVGMNPSWSEIQVYPHSISFKSVQLIIYS